MMNEKEIDLNRPNKIYLAKGHTTIQIEDFLKDFLNDKTVDEVIDYLSQFILPGIKLNILYNYSYSTITVWKYVLETDEEWDTRQKIRRGVGNVSESKTADDYDTYLRLKAKFEPITAIGIPTSDFGATMTNSNDHRGPSRLYED